MERSRPPAGSPALALTVALVLLVLLAAAMPSAAENARPRETTTAGAKGSWHEGAEGFVEALDQAMAENTPLAVYFYTDWCGYCRQLERELLFREEVESYLGTLTKVRINPERGSQENAIAQRYGVLGFPAFFLHPGPGHEARKVSGRVKRDDKWQMQTTDEFIATLSGIVDQAE